MDCSIESNFSNSDVYIVLMNAVTVKILYHANAPSVQCVHPMTDTVGLCQIRVEDSSEMCSACIHFDC